MEDRTMALERVMGIHSAPLSAVSTQGGRTAAGASASGETSRDKTQARVEKFRALIKQAARRHHLDAALLAAVVHVESGGNPQAVSPAGAQGLTQLIPATAQRFGVNDPFDPVQSLDGAARYLRGLLGQFGGDVSKALAAYNAGEGNVKKYGGIPPFAETRAYVPAVLAAYDTYRQAAPTSASSANFLRQDLQRPMGDIAAVDSGSVLASTPSPLRLAWLLEAATRRLTRSGPERDA
jgi:soluble lytic murein transglycosylase-like protein